MESNTQLYDIGIAWNWHYDRDFLDLIVSAAHARRLSVYLIDQENLTETLARLQKNALHLRVVLDRASDEDERFLPLAHLLSRRASASDPSHAVRIINPHDLQRKASDKATMHLEFLSHGVNVPFTIIISPFNQKREVELSLSELAQLGRHFIIKPANTTGGGVGVVLGAESLKDIIETRQHHKNDKYLLQEHVTPTTFAGRRAWFRVFYSFGRIIPCWWDDQTHTYEELTPADEEGFILEPMRTIASVIHDICGLDFFSTELALTANQKFIVVDYVNEMCDMRLKSRHPDGVPDSVVRTIAESLVDSADSIKSRPRTTIVVGESFNQI